MAKGLYPGATVGTWVDYVPEIRGFSALGGGITQPIWTEGSRFGRYMIGLDGIVNFEILLTIASTDVLGSGEDVWGFGLPFPANRSSGGADLPEAGAFLWQGSASNPQLNQFCSVSLMDPLSPGGTQGNEDYFCQIFIAELLAFGSGVVTFASSATTANVSYASQLGTVFTPNAYDIKLVPQNTPSTSPVVLYPSNINSGGNAGTGSFDATIKTASTTTPLQFLWQIRAWPNSSAGFAVLVNHQRPWTWATGHVLSITGRYEPRR